MAKDPRCESGGGPWSRSHHLVVNSGCRSVHAATCSQKAWAVDNYVLSCFPLRSAAVRTYVRKLLRAFDKPACSPMS